MATLKPGDFVVELYSGTPHRQIVATADNEMQMKEPRLLKVLSLLLLSLFTGSLQAHVGQHPSVHDTVAGVIDRMINTLNTNELNNITVANVESLLTPQEREILANEHISFRVNVPVRVSVLHDVRLGDDPYWLRERGFKTNGIIVKEGSAAYEAWQKDFEAGPIGLGIHALSGNGNHYLVLLKPKNPGDKIEVTDLYPGLLRTGEFKAGVEPYIDQSDTLKTVPPELEGQLLIRTYADSEDDARLVNIFRWTSYVATKKPDQVVLTWSEAWVPLFDKYHVDMALQGHDHAYLRTYPLKGNTRAENAKEGTTYVISVSGTKMYSQVKHDYTEFGMTNVATYQVLDIQISGNRLVYRAYDIDGQQRDELVIEK